jgi:NAD(P)-dependent dehydrogenase (short-subunit alcohol dehydrogenase family)
MTESSKPFDGKLALVTGASRGIGAATAEALAAAGAHVILTARTAQSLEQVEERIHAAGGTATIAPMDLTDAENIQKLAQAVAERWGSLDIMVLNAAMLGSLSPVEHLDPKELERVFKLNVFAAQAMIAAFDPLLRRAEKADVIGITGWRGAARLLGRLWRVKGRARYAAWRLCRRDRPCRSSPDPDRRSRRNPHPHAPARLPR